MQRCLEHGTRRKRGKARLPIEGFDDTLVFGREAPYFSDNHLKVN